MAEWERTEVEWCDWSGEAGENLEGAFSTSLGRISLKEVDVCNIETP